MDISKAATIILAGAVGLAGCATTSGQAIPARVVVARSEQVRIRDVRAEQRGSSVYLHGHVTRRTLSPRRIPGRIHIEVWGQQGLLAVEDARLERDFSPTRRHRRGFTAVLPVTPAAVDQIRISHETLTHAPPRLFQ